MKGKKDLLSNLVYYSGVCKLSKAWGGDHIIVINYHRIKKHHKSHNTLFDDEVFGPDQKEFERQIKWLVNNITVISESDLIAMVRGEKTPTERSVLITFDDGYIDNYTLALPVLRKYKIPAIFFVPTQAIVERRLGWWDCIAFMLKSTKKNKIVIDGVSLYPQHQLQEAVGFVLNLVRRDKLVVSDLLDNLCTVCEVDYPDLDIQDAELMTWEHLQEMVDHGMSIGAHTHSHQILANLEFFQQEDEIQKSKVIIEQKLGGHIHSMSYPVGTYRHFSDDTKKIAHAAGFELAFSFLTGINTFDSLDPMDVKRISVSNHLPRFASTLAFPQFFGDFL